MGCAKTLNTFSFFQLLVVLPLALSSFSNNILAQSILDYLSPAGAIEGPEKFDRIAIDINWTSWIQETKSVSNPNGYELNFQLFKDIPLHDKSNFAIAIGLGIRTNHVYHDGQFTKTILTTDNSEFTVLNRLPPNYDYSTNKLVCNFIDLPIEFRFRTITKTDGSESKYKFRLYPGFRIGYCYSNYTKRKDQSVKYKLYNIPNLQRIQYGTTVRVAFEKIAFNAYYNLSGLLKRNKGVNIAAISAGITWMGL